MEWRALLGRSRGLGTGRTETQRPSLPPSGMTYLPPGPEILVVESPWRRCGGGDGQGTGLLLTWYGWGDVLSGLCLERPSPLPSSTHTHLYFPWSERDPSPPPSTGVGDTQHLCSEWCVMRLISLTPRLPLSSSDSTHLRCSLLNALLSLSQSNSNLLFLIQLDGALCPLSPA